MQMHTIVACLGGCPKALLDDRDAVEQAIVAAVQAGGFTLLHLHLHRFSPQGITGSAVLAESHIAVHTWPENRCLYVDIATCGGEAATQRAFAAFCAAIAHERIDTHTLVCHNPQRASPQAG